MKKKQACQMLAGLVSICALVSLINTIQAAVMVRSTGGEFPMGMLMLTILTLVCTVVIWNGVRHMD